MLQYVYIVELDKIGVVSKKAACATRSAMAEESAQVARLCQKARETRKLSLDDCGLRKFPDAVFFLLRDVELEAVSLSGNQLKKIPAKLPEAFSSITCTFKVHKE